MKLTLGFSPCPNDTFIFDALVNHKIDTGEFEFDVVLEDVQTLNEWALGEKLDITKISYGVLPLALPGYIVLNAGGALGKGVGPLLITNRSHQQGKDVNISDATIAVPGKNTTAHMLFSLAYPAAGNKKFIRFDKIEDWLLEQTPEARYGVIIHENRFTYEKKGLKKIIDLGEYWEQQTQSPIPLGGIVIKRKFEKDLQLQIDGLIRKSVEYAFSNYPFITDYVKQHSQEMEETVMRQHIDLYVNNYTLQLGEDGKRAVQQLLEVYNNVNKFPAAGYKNIFV
jgi:1,4-dihydroxy-6-naphthoate synthase